MLKDACRSLSCADIGLIVPAIEKMTAALAMLPRLEKFGRTVLDIVLPIHDEEEGGAEEQSQPRKRRVLEDVFPVLDHWKRSTHQCEVLSNVVNQITETLGRRSHLIKPNHQLDDDASLSSSSVVGHNMSLEEIVTAIVDLCQLESQLLFQKRSFAEAEKALSLNPEVLNNRIVLHFQYLFQVKRLEGVFPKMNELYVFCSEVTSVLRALRSICRLQPNASPKTILVAVQHLLTSEAKT